MQLVRYRNPVRTDSTTRSTRSLSSPIPIDKYVSFKQRPAYRRLRAGKKLFRCIELATLLTFLQGNFLPIEQFQRQDARPQTIQLTPPIPLLQEDQALEEKLKSLCNLKGLRAGIFAAQPKSGKYVNVNGQEKFAAASMIKFPILVSLLAALDSGQGDKDSMLTIKDELVTGGSGYLQWRPKNSKVSVDEAAQLMMIVSDNTATNLIIDYLGGKSKLNQQFLQWGLTDTKVNNFLADFDGTNTTSPYDLASLMGRIDKGEILSRDSRDWLLRVMQRTRIRTLLPQGLPAGTKIAHKTGDIASMVGDAGLVTVPGGEKYLIAVQVARPRNDRRANLLIRNISKLIYQEFK